MYDCNTAEEFKNALRNIAKNYKISIEVSNCDADEYVINDLDIGSNMSLDKAIYVIDEYEKNIKTCSHTDYSYDSDKRNSLSITYFIENRGPNNPSCAKAITLYFTCGDNEQIKETIKRLDKPYQKIAKGYSRLYFTSDDVFKQLDTEITKIINIIMKKYGAELRLQLITLYDVKDFVQAKFKRLEFDEDDYALILSEDETELCITHKYLFESTKIVFKQS